MIKMKCGLLLIMLALASDENEVKSEKSEKKKTNNENLVLVKIEEEEYAKVLKNTSEYIGVSYNKRNNIWRASRRSKNEMKMVHNGCYKDEETAAHASDTLARKFMANGEQKLKLNFPNDITEVYAEKESASSIYLGVTYNKQNKTWEAKRWSKDDYKTIYNGRYNDEDTAAHASDTLARKLMKNGEENHKLNFPNDITEGHPEKSFSSIYFGVSYNKRYKTWRAYRWSKNEMKMVHNGTYKDEEKAAHASDTLARKLMTNGEENHRLNFPDESTEEEEYAKVPKKTSKYIGVFESKTDKRWRASRRSKNEMKMIHNGSYKDENTAAHASDTLARKLMENGEQNHKINFPNHITEVNQQRQKRKRSGSKNLRHSENK